MEAKTHDHITAEAADVIYFTLVYCARAGVSIADIEKELDRYSHSRSRQLVQLLHFHFCAII